MPRLENIVRWFSRFFRRSISLPPVDNTASEPTIGHNQPPTREKQHRDDFGTLYYLDDLLDRLSDYGETIKFLRSTDPAAYMTYRQFGATIVGKRSLFNFKEMPPTWRGGARPSIGMVHFGFPRIEERVGWLNLEFGYFTKLESRPRVQTHKGDLYEVTVLYTQRKSYNGKKPVRYSDKYYVAIDDRCGVKVLRELISKRTTIDHGKHRDSYPQNVWCQPAILQELLKDAIERGLEEQTIADIGRRLFVGIASTIEGASGGFQVRASKAGTTAIFGIDMKRSAYFFRDRDKSPDQNGTAQKKIFHFVRPHSRVVSGQTKFVRSHFRGLRQFQWNGHDVTITMPGLHHAPISDFDAAGTIIDSGDPIPRGSIAMPLVAKKIAEFISRRTANDMSELTGG